jgi:hypothetical protein
MADGALAGKMCLARPKRPSGAESCIGAFVYRVNNRLSVGGGLSLLYGKIGVRTNINNLEPSASVGRVRFKDTDTDTGWNTGLLVQSRVGTHVGLTYTSRVNSNPDWAGSPERRCATRASG